MTPGGWSTEAATLHEWRSTEKVTGYYIIHDRSTITLGERRKDKLRFCIRGRGPRLTCCPDGVLVVVDPTATTYAGGGWVVLGFIGSLVVYCFLVWTSLKLCGVNFELIKISEAFVCRSAEIGK